MSATAPRGGHLPAPDATLARLMAEHTGRHIAGARCRSGALAAHLLAGGEAPAWTPRALVVFRAWAPPAELAELERLGILPREG